VLFRIFIEILVNFSPVLAYLQGFLLGYNIFGLVSFNIGRFIEVVSVGKMLKTYKKPLKSAKTAEKLTKIDQNLPQIHLKLPKKLRKWPKNVENY